MGEGILYVEDFVVRYMNPAAESITGFSKDEGVGRRCFEIMRTDLCQRSCPIRRGHKLPWTSDGVFSLDRFNEEKFLDLRITKVGKGWAIIFQDKTREVRLVREVKGKFRFQDIVTASPKMLEILRLLPKVASTDSPVLIEGESGTGKELVASAIQELSPRSKGPYIKINCASIPEGLMESELFGYRKGAFTDAKSDKKGVFAMADRGTLLLDEVAELPLPLQAKLLRVLQEGEFIPLGGISPVRVNVRVIASTNKNLALMVREGKFREDLFYRLNVIYLRIPPLRERKEDIPLLVEHFVDLFNSIYGKHIQGLSDEAMGILMEYDYPGNVRELKNIIETAFVLTSGDIITPQDLPSYLRGDEAERRKIEEALRRTRWRREDAAKLLGISRTTLWRKMKKYGIKF